MANPMKLRQAQIADLLDLLGQATRPVTVTELATKAGLTPAVVFALVKAMERDGKIVLAGAAPNTGRTWRLA